MKTTTSNQKLVNVRVNFDLWKRAKIRAVKEEATVTDIFRKLLEHYVRQGLPSKVARKSSSDV